MTFIFLIAYYFIGNGNTQKKGIMKMSESTKRVTDINENSKELRSNSTGEVIVKYKNGDIFVGVLEKGKKICGKYYYSNKSVYDGFFMNEKKSGFGKLSKKNNEEFYYGNFEDGKKQGAGFQKYWNGDFYYGEWKNNKKNGRGIYYVSSRKEYLSGEWTKGYLVNGSWLAGSDFKYDGKFFQNKPKKNGLFSFLNDLEINIHFKQLLNISDSNNDYDAENIHVYWYHKN